MKSTTTTTSSVSSQNCLDNAIIKTIALPRNTSFGPIVMRPKSHKKQAQKHSHFNTINSKIQKQKQKQSISLQTFQHVILSVIVLLLAVLLSNIYLVKFETSSTSPTPQYKTEHSYPVSSAGKNKNDNNSKSSSETTATNQQGIPSNAELYVAEAPSTRQLQPQKPQLEKRYRSSSSFRLDTLDSLFPDHVLDDAWERYPLFVTSSQETVKEKQFSSIPTHVPTKSNDIGMAREWITITDLDKILSDPQIVHGNDYIIAKKVIRDGQEWMGRPQQSSIKMEEARKYVFYGGFSIIINSIHRRWKMLQEISRRLEQETLSNYISCNLYMTPRVQAQNSKLPPERSAFETHWDWMDVIIVQVEGEKVWHVAKEPIVKLSTMDLKRKPTVQEIETYMHDSNHYSSFLMKPGDVLYIPRGYMHNASTVPSTNEEHSIHLSFGIEHLCETTFEALLHHALEYYALYDPSLQLASIDPTFCTHQPSTPQSSTLTWKILLHYAISAVARMDIVENYTDHDVDVSILRSSVPLHPVWEDIHSNSTFQTYTKSLSILRNLGLVSRTTYFVNTLREQELMRTNFCLAGTVPQHALFKCDGTRFRKPKFGQLWRNFITHVGTHSAFQQIMQKFRTYLAYKKISARKQDDDFISSLDPFIIQS